MPDIGYLLINHAKRLKAAQTHALETSNITVSQWALLAALARTTSATAAELAAALDMDKPTMSGIVSRLVAKKMISKSPKPSDRRASLLKLTELGRKTYTQCAQIAQQTAATYLAALTPTQQAQLQDLLTQLEEGHEHA
ncbi:MarR family winged helix-turn-helix transcriptional regulator [Lacticaseibacillus jixiensis]|uniref:MarR family winged helix-turn-helix transcriptional regulator n=1 Tax=Lacticaseibacillus jixiensis TaxID=3231926 RepID=UPI0036F243D2